MGDEYFEESSDLVTVCVGVTGWLNSARDWWIAEDDYRVNGEVWRVHKFDADPFPSRPHAHCVSGAKRFVGRKLHLGTRELFIGHQSTGDHLTANAI